MGAAVVPIMRGGASSDAVQLINPALEDAYWRRGYASRTYVRPGASYELYRLAYRHGWESRARYVTLDWARAEPHISQDWKTRGSLLAWPAARPAVRDAWERVDRLR